MPPKRQASVSSISINSISTNKFRSNAATDLVTASQAALSSQASVLQKTNHSQASQDSNFNFSLPDNDDMQFNRDEMSEVQISKQEQEMIQKILEVARKGKINSKNAFEIPIKVVNSETSFSVNNKFWKFASELLSASMSIYDKRVENMYLSTGAFENKLSRIGFDIKNRKQGDKDQGSYDDVHADEDSKARKSREERYDILKISVDQFSGHLNFDDETVIGYQTLDKKDKLDMKNLEQKFLADPTFERTQKMFDSFSLKSLMLNIFELSTELDVRIFNKSDLEWKQLKEEDQERTQKQFSLNRSHVQEQRESQEEGEETETNKSIAQFEAYKENCEGQPLASYMMKHIEASRAVLEKNNLFEEIQNFIVKQPELKEDFFIRQRNLKNKNESEVENQNQENVNGITFGEIIERERNQFSEILKDFEGCYDEDIGGHHFEEIKDGEGLFETNQESQSQAFENSHPLRFSDSFANRQNSDDIDVNSMPTMPVSFQQSFYSWEEKNHVIEPIMPWEIQFKNLELTKKMKKGSKKVKKQGKKPSKQKTFNVSFDLQILDRKEVLAQKDTKKKFDNQKIVNVRMKERKIVGKECDVVHSEFHSKFSNRFLNVRSKLLKEENSQTIQGFGENKVSDQNFVFDLDNSIDPEFGQKKDQGQFDNADEQTRLQLPQSYPQNHESNIFQSAQKITKNTDYFGNQMGVNNIRQIKAFIVSEINEKGRTTLEFMNRMLVNLSPQQLFTIFLHLTNEHQYEIFNEDPEETTIVLVAVARNRKKNGKSQSNNNGYEEIEI